MKVSRPICGHPITSDGRDEGRDDPAAREAHVAHLSADLDRIEAARAERAARRWTL